MILTIFFLPKITTILYNTMTIRDTKFKVMSSLINNGQAECVCQSNYLMYTSITTKEKPMIVNEA